MSTLIYFLKLDESSKELFLRRTFKIIEWFGHPYQFKRFLGLKIFFFGADRLIKVYIINLIARSDQYRITKLPYFAHFSLVFDSLLLVNSFHRYRRVSQ